MNKLILKRDETSTANPDPSQLVVGELVMNAVTGKLFTKLVDGSVIEFLGKRICNGVIPSISFADVSNFCCYSDMLTVTIRDLQPEPKNYSFDFEELTGNNSSGTINTPIYTSYVSTDSNGIPAGQSLSLREANVPVTISIANPNNINIFKFSVYSDNIKITEKTLAITCNSCG
jgi:hypothetical protein